MMIMIMTHRALMATLIGMVMANIGVLPAGAPELSVVYKYILPLVGHTLAWARSYIPHGVGHITNIM
jgi:hypothetical protein